MTREDVIKAVDPIRPGSYVNITYQKSLKYKDSSGNKKTATVKVSKVIRLKCQYANMKGVAKDKSKIRLPIELEIDAVKPYLVLYCGSNPEIAKGTTYLRYALSRGTKHSRTEIYEVDGRVLEDATDADLISKLRDLSSHCESDKVQRIKISNIIKIGK